MKETYINLQEKAKELIKLVKDNFNFDPYTEIIITEDQFRIKQDNFGLPLDLKEATSQPTIKENKIYYLSHPLTSYGSMAENYLKESNCCLELKNTYPDIHLVRPLCIIPITTLEESAMNICMKLLEACDGIILCGDWSFSKGCIKEWEYAKEHEMDIISYNDIIKEP